MPNPQNGTTEEMENSTHLMVVRTAGQAASPKYFNDLKAATDSGDEIIKKDPAAECDVYQIKVRMKGSVEVLRKEFN